MTFAHILRDRYLHGTLVHGEGATGMEPAARRRVNGRWDLSRKDNFLPCIIRMGRKRRRKQSLGIRMQGVHVEVLGRRIFHDLPEIHHGSLVSHVPYRAKIVGNQ